MATKTVPAYSLENPLAPGVDKQTSGADTPWESMQRRAAELIALPRVAASPIAVNRQHARSRMTVWERIELLSDSAPELLFQNWGANLDGASLVTAVLEIGGRKIAFYGHDFTVRAGSMDATNGRKLARLFELAGKRGIPVIGINDSAGAYVPAGVGGLDGYAEAFTALRRISGVVPSIMCMFGFNAGGGSYLPRQGSFVIQPQQSFFGLTGPAVVKSVLGEEVSPEELGGPAVHSASGVTDLVAADEVSALRKARELLAYLPDNNYSTAPFRDSADPGDRLTPDILRLLSHAFESPTGMNTPLDIAIVLTHICDYGDYFELQPERARNTITAFGRLGGHVVGFVANNSAVASGQIDIAAATKNARFIRFCNLYNIPVVFMEDTTGFLPGREQESGGVVQAGRAMLDAIIDLRTPRFLVVVRNAFGGAYASFNNYATGADLVLALPSARLAVMGPAGISFVYKDELRKIAREAAALNRKQGEEAAAQWQAEQEAGLAERYQRELMNPEEGLALGSISALIMPEDLRRVLTRNMDFHMRRYNPSPLSGIQREFY